MKHSKSAQNISMGNKTATIKPESSTALLRNEKESYLSSGGNTTASTSVTGAYCAQSSDDNLSGDPRYSNNTHPQMHPSMHRAYSNPHFPHLVSNSLFPDRRRPPHSRRKKQQPSNIHIPYAAAYQAHPSPVPYHYPPVPYGPHRYPTVPAHGDVAVTQSYTPTPPPSYHANTNHNNTANTALSLYYYKKPFPPNNVSNLHCNVDIDIMEIPNAEPSDDVTPKNKLFSEHSNDGYENDAMDIKSVSEYKNTNTATNYMKLCAFTCDWDMENVFEVIEILILFVFIAFIAVWWVDRNNTAFLLFTLTICCGFFGLLAVNMRRVQSCLRLHELGSTLNDFRFILFTIGLIVVIIADQLRYTSDKNITVKYLWMAHSFVFCIAAMLWCTIDFATYMSYIVSISYFVFILTGTTLEFARVCYQMADVNHIPTTIYEYNGVPYVINDFKMDGVLLMLMAEISTLITLIRDRKREWYCFGPTHVYRHRLLEISRRQRGMIHVNSSQHHHHHPHPHYPTDPNNLSGYSYHLHASNEDSLLLIWIINLSSVAYLTFFLWDLHSVYKSIPAAIGILALIVLTYRECDFHLVPLIKQQTHCWFVSFALLELWFVTIYSSLYVDGNANGRWKQIGSLFVDMTVLMMACALLFVTDLLVSNVSSYFILRGTLPAMLLFIALFSAWYQSFCNDVIKNEINWRLSIVIRNAYYILCTMSTVSIVKWIRDPIHKYFIFILNRRKRTILNEHKYRNEESTTTNQTPIASNLSLHMFHRQHPDNTPEMMYYNNTNITRRWK